MCVKERERHRETRSKRSLLRISPLLLHSARNLTRRRETSDFAGKTSDGDYLLIIHYSYASCSKLSRYAQGDKALVTFSLLAVSTSSPMPPNTKAYSASKHAKCPTSSLFLYQPDQIAPSAGRADSFTVRTSYRSLPYLYLCIQKGTLDPVLWLNAV